MDSILRYTPGTVEWAASRSGRLQIALAPFWPDTENGDMYLRRRDPERCQDWRVWAKVTGTAADFVDDAYRAFTGPTAEADARAYANDLWRTR